MIPRRSSLFTVVAVAVAAAMAALMLATAASAQPVAATSAASKAPGRQGEGVRWGRGVTPGWSLMTPAEREAHRRRMQGAKTAAECRDVAAAHRAFIERRADERGRGGLALMPHHDPCTRWR